MDSLDDHVFNVGKLWLKDRHLMFTFGILGHAYAHYLVTLSFLSTSSPALNDIMLMQIMLCEYILR
jgi:hypothetical protein